MSTDRAASTSHLWQEKERRQQPAPVERRRDPTASQPNMSLFADQIPNLDGLVPAP